MPKRVKAEPFEDAPELRQQVIGTCLQLKKMGYIIGTWGNVGVRVQQGLLVTPTCLDYDEMKPEDLVVVSWEGTTLSGHRLPTSEVHLHRLLLSKRSDLGVLIHNHSPWASSVACAGKAIPPIAEDMAQIIGGEVQCSRYVVSSKHIAFGEAALEAMGTSVTAALLANHGVIVGGRSLQEAVATSAVLEKAAKMFVLGECLGGSKALPPEIVEEERHRYLYKYGTAEDFK